MALSSGKNVEAKGLFRGHSSLQHFSLNLRALPFAGMLQLPFKLWTVSEAFTHPGCVNILTEPFTQLLLHAEDNVKCLDESETRFPNLECVADGGVVSIMRTVLFLLHWGELIVGPWNPPS